MPNFITSLIVQWDNTQHKLKQFARQQHGATAVEYGLIAAGIAIAIIIVVFLVGDELSSLFKKTQTYLGSD